MASTKATGVPCYDKAAPDEPLFVLNASDPAAPYAIREWARMAEKLGHRESKVDGARHDADDFDDRPVFNVVIEATHQELV